MSEVYDIAGVSSLDTINQDIVSRNNLLKNTNDINRRQYIKDIGDLRSKVKSADPTFDKVKDSADTLADAGYSIYTGVKVGKGEGAKAIGQGIREGLSTITSSGQRATRRAEFLNQAPTTEPLQSVSRGEPEGTELGELPRASRVGLEAPASVPQASTARFVGRRQGESFDLFDDEARTAERLGVRPTTQGIDRFLGTATGETPAGYGARVLQPPLTFSKENEEREAEGTGEELAKQRPDLNEITSKPPEDIKGTELGAESVENEVKSGGDLLKGIGKGLAVLNVGQGVYDAGQDILSGGIKGENKNLRTANVLGMVSGGADAVSLGAGSIAGALESAGVIADSTGIGAPIGLAMGLVGAGVGVAGAVEDYIGGKKKKQDLQNQLKSAVAKTPIQQTPQAISTSTAGEVRQVAKGMGAIS